MDAGPMLLEARTTARMTQRDVARAAGMPQSAVARIERGRVIPRVSTLTRLLSACGFELELAREPGFGVDRSHIRELLKLSPRERLELAVQEERGLQEFLAASR